MTRMKERVDQAQLLYFCKPWSSRFAAGQWRYILHIRDSDPLLWARRMCKNTFNPHVDPHGTYSPSRMRGRPRMKWDDHVLKFCHQRWPHLSHMHWFDILVSNDLHDCEDAFVRFVSESL